MDTWEMLKRAHKQIHNIPNIYVLDYIAVQDILKECCYGKSVQSIASRLDLDEDYIRNTIKEFFAFSGFEKDLDFDCRTLYNRHKYNKYVYLLRAREIDLVSSSEDIKTSYRINEIFDRIEREIETYYANC